MVESERTESTSGGILQEIFTSPLNLTLLSLCLFLIYKIFRGDRPLEVPAAEETLPKMKKRDFTIAELKQYDGVQNPRILMAVSGKVFDVTRGKKFYGPGNAHLYVIMRFFCFLFLNRVNTYTPMGVTSSRSAAKAAVCSRCICMDMRYSLTVNCCRLPHHSR